MGGGENKEYKSCAEDVEKLDPQTWLKGYSRSNGAANAENSLVIPQRVNHRIYHMI